MIGVISIVVVLAVISCTQISGQCSRQEEKEELTKLEKQTYDKVLKEMKKDMNKI